jgi:hypothetical protein
MKDFKNYGGRGISFAPRWDVFENFIADMGEPAPNMTLGRIDNNANYGPGNCRWESRLVQGQNKRNNVRYTFNGQSLTLVEWSKQTGIGRITLLKRIQSGVPLEVAFTTKGFLGYRRELEKNGVLVRTHKVPVRKSTGPFYTFNGKTLTLAQWEKETGIKRLTLRKRIASGMPIEQALTIKNIFDHRRELKAT